MNDIVQSVVLMVAAIALSIVGCGVANRLFHEDVREQHNDVSGFVYAVVGPMYAILLAFVVFVVWGHYEETAAAVAGEANEIAGIWRQAPALGGTDGPALRDLSVTYTEDVVHKDWPLLSKGQLSPEGDKDLVNIYQLVLNLPAASGRDQVLMAQLLSETHNLANERRIRLLKTEDTLHPILWVVLLLGGALTIGYAYVFGLKSKRMHAVLVAILAGTVVGMLCMIKMIDGPFAGTVSVTPEAFEAILKTMTAS